MDEQSNDRDQQLAAFRELAEDMPSSRDDVFPAALRIAAIEHPEWEPGWWTAWEEKLDALSAQVCEALAAQADVEAEPAEAFHRLACMFHGVLGFRGNQEDHHDPANSCLTSVLSTRRGLPITLSIIMISLGRRAGLKLFGVGTPGRFLTGAFLPGGRRYVDPFSGPELMDDEGALEHVARAAGVGPALLEPFFDPATPMSILRRMLNNLKVSYMRAGEMEKLLRTLTWLVELDPGNLPEVRNRGLILLRVGRTKEGAAELLRYLDASPEAGDLQVIRDEALRAGAGSHGLN